MLFNRLNAKINLYYIWKLVPTSQRTHFIPVINTKLLIYCDGKVFLGAFTKLRKAIISFVISFCPSVCPHTIPRLPLDGFLLNLIFVYFSKICYKNSSFIKISQDVLHEDQHTFFIISLSFLLRMRNFSDKLCTEHWNTNFMFSILSLGVPSPLRIL